MHFYISMVAEKKKTYGFLMHDYFLLFTVVFYVEYNFLESKTF